MSLQKSIRFHQKYTVKELTENDIDVIYELELGESRLLSILSAT